jgi:hypothetical protein
MVVQWIIEQIRLKEILKGDFLRDNECLFCFVESLFLRVTLFPWLVCLKSMWERTAFERSTAYLIEAADEIVKWIEQICYRKSSTHVN